jgi:hypothetical protein
MILKGAGFEEEASVPFKQANNLDDQLRKADHDEDCLPVNCQFSDDPFQGTGELATMPPALLVVDLWFLPNGFGTDFGTSIGTHCFEG